MNNSVRTRQTHACYGKGLGTRDASRIPAETLGRRDTQSLHGDSQGRGSNCIRSNLPASPDDRQLPEHLGEDSEAGVGSGGESAQ